MTGNYRTFTECPSYEQVERDPSGMPRNQAPGRTLWGGEAPPPAIGTRIRVTMNSLGPGTVRGYFIEYDWLGLLVELHDPPEWWIKQNGTYPRHTRLAHIFGIEFKPQ